MSHLLHLFVNKHPNGLITNSKTDRETATPPTLKKWAANFIKTKGSPQIKWYKSNPNIKGLTPFWVSSDFSVDGKEYRMEIHQDGYGK